MARVINNRPLIVPGGRAAGGRLMALKLSSCWSISQQMGPKELDPYSLVPTP